MRVTVDVDQCEANGVCVGFAPEVFDLDDEDQLQIQPVDSTPSVVERVTQAVAGCPKNALRMTE